MDGSAINVIRTSKDDKYVQFNHRCRGGGFPTLTLWSGNESMIDAALSPEERFHSAAFPGLVGRCEGVADDEVGGSQAAEACGSVMTFSGWRSQVWNAARNDFVFCWNFL
jgi:hypothetical protein